MKATKAARLVLEIAQGQQMFDAFLIVLNVAVEHGGVGTQADLVGGARNIEPLLPADLVVADDPAHARIENFRRRRRTPGIDLAGILEGNQGIVNGKLGDAREVADLDHGEGLQVLAGTASLEAAYLVEKIGEREIGMQAADEVKLRGAFAQALLGALPNLFERERVCAGRIRAAAKGARACNARRRRWCGLMCRLTLK